MLLNVFRVVLGSEEMKIGHRNLTISANRIVAFNHNTCFRSGKQFSRGCDAAGDQMRAPALRLRFFS